jgi:hypothetical protein
MKKVFSVAFLAILSLSIILYSCQKGTKQDIPELNKQYSKEQMYSYYNSLEIQKLDKSINFATGKKTRKLTGKQAAQLIVSDVEGGFAGGKIGSFGGPLGAMGGAVGGAVIASAFKWWSSDWPWGVAINPDDRDFGQGGANGVGSVGYYHNIYCRQSLNNPDPSTHSNFTSFSNFFMSTYSGSIATNIGLSSNFFSSNIQNEIIAASAAAIEVKDFPSASSFLHSYSNDQHVNSIMLMVLERLFQIDSEQNYNAFYDYADSFTNLVQNDDTLSIEQKNLILHSLSILKYSASLWKNNLQ